MKSTVLVGLFMAFFLSARAQEPTYREALQKVRDRQSLLEMKLFEPGGLTSQEEQERLKLSRQLKIEDPVGTILSEIQARIRSTHARFAILQAGGIVTKRDLAPSGVDVTKLDNLKEFLAILSEVEELADTRVQAEEIATIMRRFIARDDVQGASTWRASR